MPAVEDSDDEAAEAGGTVPAHLDLDEADHDEGFTALHYAVFFGRIEIVTALLAEVCAHYPRSPTASPMCTHSPIL